MLFGLIHDVPSEQVTREPVVYWQAAPIRAFCTACATERPNVERVEYGDVPESCDGCGGEFVREVVTGTATVEFFPCRIF